MPCARLLLAAFHALLDAHGSGRYKGVWEGIECVLLRYTFFCVTGFTTASFLAQSCGIQLAVYVLQAASHILFHFSDTSFPPNFRPKAAAAMQSLISSAHTLLASPLFTTHLPALSLRLRSW